MFDPLSLALIGGGALLRGFQASKQKKAAKEAEEYNRQASALDTEFAPFVRTKAMQVAQPDAGPGVLAGALSGGLSGFQFGQNVKLGEAKDNLYDALLKLRQGKGQAGGQLVGMAPTSASKAALGGGIIA